MSRPMALGLILLVLFLTSQSEWKPPKEGENDSEAKGSKMDLHREEIKEKIIVDLTAHNKQLESESLKLRTMVSSLRDLLDGCRCVMPVNATAALLEIESTEESATDESGKEEIELLGGGAGVVTEPLVNGRLERVRFGHALAGRVETTGTVPEAKDGLRRVAGPDGNVGSHEAAPRLRAGSGEGFDEKQSLD